MLVQPSASGIGASCRLESAVTKRHLRWRRRFIYRPRDLVRTMTKRYRAEMNEGRRRV